MTPPPSPTDLWADLWAWSPIAASIAVSVPALAAVVLLIVGTVRLIRGTRAAPGHVKLQVGNFIVQAGVTVAVVTGVYEFCHGVFGMPQWEAAVIAVVLEAATWVAVGRILQYAHGRDAEGNPNKGFGPAYPAFWLFSIGGAVLAMAGSSTPAMMLGRAVVVVFGTALWYLTLLSIVTPDTAPSRFRWTPRRLLVAIGAIEPADQDVSNQHQEWQIRRMARAMRWANGRPPMKWIGHRVLVARAEQTDETIIAAARRRYAAAHLLVDSIRPDSEVMQRVIAAVQIDPAEAAREAAAREEAEQRRREEAAERARLAELTEQRRREELQLQREREEREHDLAKARIAAEAEIEKLRLAAEQARAEGAAAAAKAAARTTSAVPRTSAPPPPSRGTGPGEVLDGIPEDLADRPLEWQRRWLNIPGKSKTEKARNWILQQWEAGVEPDGPEVDEVVGGRSLGRAEIRKLKETHGHLLPSARPSSEATSSPDQSSLAA